MTQKSVEVMRMFSFLMPAEVLDGLDLYSSLPVWTAAFACTFICCAAAYLLFLLEDSHVEIASEAQKDRSEHMTSEQKAAAPIQSRDIHINPRKTASLPLQSGPGLGAQDLANSRGGLLDATDLSQSGREILDQPVGHSRQGSVSAVRNGDSAIVAKTPEATKALNGPATPQHDIGMKAGIEPGTSRSSVTFQDGPDEVAEIPEEDNLSNSAGSVQFSGPSFKDLNIQLLERGPLEANVTDGEHHYVWEDNSEYFGTWENGQANGRGTFNWPSGDKYEGEWTDGLESGMGAYIAKDGSSFQGHWLGGQMHGKGVFQAGAVPETPGREVYFMRMYNNGKLIAEEKLRDQEKDSLKKTLKMDHTRRKDEKRLAARDKAIAPQPGEVIYKGHRSYALMKSLQLGLLFSISQGGRADMNKKPSTADFKKTIRQTFPRSGDVAGFKWKDYSPLIFRRLRGIFGIDDADYMLSLTGDSKLRELPSPGKSASVFFISGDDRFMIKTVRKEEMNLLLDLIPKYHQHCVRNPQTLLTRFFGVHRIKPLTGNQVRFVVMANVFPVDTRLHRKFDLKGSTYGRTAGDKKDDPNATLKDLDVDFKLEMKKNVHADLMHQLQCDADFLQEMYVMDYSLLLGMHYTQWGNSWNPVASNTIPRGSPLSDYGPRAEVRNSIEYESDGATGSIRGETFRVQGNYTSANSQEPHMQPIFGSQSSFREPETIAPSIMTSQVNTEIEPSSRNSSLTSQDTSVLSSKPNSLLSSIRSRRMDPLMQGTQFNSRPPDLPMNQRRNSPASTIDLELHQNGASGLPRLRGAGNASESSVDTLRDSLKASVTRVEFMNDGNSSSDVTPTASEAHRRRLAGGGGTFRAPLDRSRSGWLKDSSLENLKSLKGDPINHMGCSLPAMAIHNGDADSKPDPVTLFIGIIDFLQMYNLRKRSEHVLKSMVQGPTISVTHPKPYAKRFIKFMEGIFVASEQA